MPVSLTLNPSPQMGEGRAKKSRRDFHAQPAPDTGASSRTKRVPMHYKCAKTSSA